MTARLLSLPSVTALVSVMNGYWDGEKSVGVRIATHAELGDFFGALDIEVADEPSIGKKIRATLARLNTTKSEHAALRRLLEQVADSRFHRGRDHAAALAHLNDNLRGDGYELREIGSVFRLVTLGTNVAAAAALQDKTRSLDLDSVRTDFERALSEAEANPEGAITAACSTVESVCKCILDEAGEPYPSNQDIKGLTGAVAKLLSLSPGRDDLPKEWEADIRQILQGLVTTVGGIGALRTHAGDAHGKGKRRAPVDSRIARLAIHAASTVSLFYLETWERHGRKTRPDSR